MARHKTWKLFVWEDVFCDYTCGIAFALARDEVEALEILRGKLDDWEMIGLESKKPKSYPVNKPYAKRIHGGG